MRTLRTALGRFSIALLLLFSFSGLKAAPDPVNGQKVFENTCTACHKLGGVLIGPDLTGVKKRWPDQAKLHAFVKNPAAFIDKDPYIKGLQAKYNAVMAIAPLKDADIDDVLAYADGGGATGVSVAPPTGAPQQVYTPVPQDNSWLRWLFYGIVILLIVSFYYTNRLIRNLTKNTPDKPEKEFTSTWPQRLNGIMAPLFLILWFVLMLYETSIHSKFLLPESASDVGVEIDRLFNITAMVTGFVFVVVQIALFAYVYRFRHKDGTKAYFYSHNNQIEFIWTIIPAVAMAALVLYGFKTWQKATSNPDDHPVLIECYAYQFAWEFRYPGPDGKLGRTDFRKIDMATNPFGLDMDDPASKDDFTTKELHMPVNKDVKLVLRSRDVTHGAYLPNFRAQMYAQPGMENKIRFKPIITTAQMRAKLHKPNYEYEMACNQLCGAAHFNMRRVIVVETEEEFAKWSKSFKPFYATFMENNKATALSGH